MWCVAGATRDNGRFNSTIGIILRTNATCKKVFIVEFRNFLVFMHEGGTSTQKALTGEVAVILRQRKSKEPTGVLPHTSNAFYFKKI